MTVRKKQTKTPCANSNRSMFLENVGDTVNNFIAKGATDHVVDLHQSPSNGKQNSSVVDTTPKPRRKPPLRLILPKKSSKSPAKRANTAVRSTVKVV